MCLSVLLLAACAPRLERADPASPPAPRLPGLTRSAYLTAGGETVYYESGGQGSPVVLIHGIGGGNSGVQWRLNTEALAREHTLYVLDIPGFGRSPAQAKEYTAQLYLNSIADFLKQVPGPGAAVVASSLPAAYVIDIAAREPNLIGKLLLVSPTGLDRLNRAPNEGFYRQLTTTPLGRVIATTLRSDVGINYFLNTQVYLDTRRVRRDITKLYAGNLAGANKEYPVFAFISNKLDLSVAASWPQTRQPAALVWGAQDVNTPLSGAQAFTQARPEVPLTVLSARAIPNDEQAEAFNALALAFLK